MERQLIWQIKKELETRHVETNYYHSGKTLNTKSKLLIKIISFLLGLMMKTVCDNNKLFSFLKSCKQNQSGMPRCQQRFQLVTDTSESADVYNQQFPDTKENRSFPSFTVLCRILSTLYGKTTCSSVSCCLIGRCI